MKKCSICGSTKGYCPECGKSFEHGTASHCDEPACEKVNAPIDCHCGFVVCDDLNGVLDFAMTLYKWNITPDTPGT